MALDGDGSYPEKKEQIIRTLPALLKKPQKYMANIPASAMGICRT